MTIPTHKIYRRADSRVWARWTRCSYSPGVTASEFLGQWIQTLGDVLNINGTEAVPEWCQFLQFMNVIESHPDMEPWARDYHGESKGSGLMSHVYSSFMRYASDLPAHKEVFLFVARSSTGSRAEQIPFLERSLRLTKKSYEQDYGPLHCSDADCRFYTFIQSSNAPFPHRGETSNMFASLCDDVEKYDGRLIVVTNGWDGLTTDRHSFMKLFSIWAKRVTLRVFVEIPRKFFEADVTKICQYFDGEIQIDVEKEKSQDSTALFLSRFHDISVLKEQLSLDSTFLRELTEYRNLHPDMRDLSKYVCEKCGTPCDTALSLNRHMHHQHELYEDPETELVCPHCGEKFKRKYHRDRHASTTCPQRPSNIETEPSVMELDREDELPMKKQKRTKRGTKLRTLSADAQPRGSDNGLLSYLQLTEQHVGRLPRIELDPNRLEGLETDIIYKGEIYCRYPSCTHPHRYSEATKLRTHYRISHQFEYHGSSPGHLGPADNREHQNGLRWLAVSAQIGVKAAGQKPKPSRK